ncbi:trypsin-like peptidase domain-containing protein [Novosphingobium humi]|uniref:Trypsin-like peptidase domain-containing protein n=1 Tax=Novosphingobium humi TaxID=2282397 RepID=A0ABY7TRX5_9SPHN|nr:trypsin-like peptidase domain-containing protein [Novosphingobium humi]WCT75952.1 hypothetical protein PQ457_08235 [Novosphingobium humi]WJS97587.1 serine protease [Novosphingobium humi]
MTGMHQGLWRGAMALMLASFASMAGAGESDKAPDPVAATCRPAFAVDDGTMSAGTAFLLDMTEPPSPSNPLAPRPPALFLVTALHLFGPNGGLAAQIPSEHLPDHVKMTACISADGQHWAARRTLAIAGAVPMATPFRDVAAFAADPASLNGATRLQLADKPAAVGDEVWVVASMGGDGRIRRYGARVIYNGPDALQYAFVDGTLDMRASSGAAVVDDAGRVLGLHLGGGKDRGDLLGMAVPLDRLRALIGAAK